MSYLRRRSTPKLRLYRLSVTKNRYGALFSAFDENNVVLRVSRSLSTMRRHVRSVGGLLLLAMVRRHLQRRRRRRKRPVRGEEHSANGSLRHAAGEAAESHREGFGSGERLRCLLGQYRERRTGSAGSRLQPRVPSRMRRHVAGKAPGLPDLQNQTRTGALRPAGS